MHESYGKLQPLTLTRYELLEAANRIAKRYGGRHLGCVEGYRNQWLISVEVRDTDSEPMLQMLRSFAALAGRSEEMADIEAEMGGRTYWFRLGFCQTNITRAPDGGFTLKIPHEVLARCRTPDHVVMYFESMMGLAEERAFKRQRWEETVDAAPVDDPGLRASFRLVRETIEAQELAGVLDDR